jgi:hypothetical protein
MEHFPFIFLITVYNLQGTVNWRWFLLLLIIEHISVQKILYYYIVRYFAVHERSLYSINQQWSYIIIALTRNFLLVIIISVMRFNVLYLPNWETTYFSHSRFWGKVILLLIQIQILSGVLHHKLWLCSISL